MAASRDTHSPLFQIIGRSRVEEEKKALLTSSKLHVQSVVIAILMADGRIRQEEYLLMMLQLAPGDAYRP